MLKYSIMRLLVSRGLCSLGLVIKSIQIEHSWPYRDSKSDFSVVQKIVYLTEVRLLCVLNSCSPGSSPVTDFYRFCNKLSGLITARNILTIWVTVKAGVVRELLRNEKVVFTNTLWTWAPSLLPQCRMLGRGFPEAVLSGWINSFSAGGRLTRLRDPLSEASASHLRTLSKLAETKDNSKFPTN
jgi:hypothetical protein